MVCRTHTCGPKDTFLPSSSHTCRSLFINSGAVENGPFGEIEFRCLGQTINDVDAYFTFAGSIRHNLTILTGECGVGENSGDSRNFHVAQLGVACDAPPQTDLSPSTTQFNGYDYAAEYFDCGDKVGSDSFDGRFTCYSGQACTNCDIQYTGITIHADAAKFSNRCLGGTGKQDQEDEFSEESAGRTGNLVEERLDAARRNWQDHLVIVSAVLSFIKSIMAFGTYSYWHVLFALLELLCTGIALSLFIGNDFHEDADNPEYSDDTRIFLLAFLSALCTELMDVVVTTHTVRSFKKIDSEEDPSTVKVYRGAAFKSYMSSLILSAVFQGLAPVLAFRKAGWESDYFTPSDLGDGVTRLMYPALIMAVATQGLIALLTTCCACDGARLLNAMVAGSFIMCVPGLISGILFWICLARADSGMEAGSLAYLLLINVPQSIELSAELTRFMVWLAAEHRDNSE